MASNGNPDSILAFIPDGLVGVRDLSFVLNAIPSDEWQRLFFAAFSAEDDSDPPELIFNLEPDDDGTDDDPPLIAGWPHVYRKDLRTAIEFDAAIMTVKGLDPEKEYAVGDGTDDGVIDIINDVVAAVGETDTTADNYNLSLHSAVSDRQSDVDDLQEKFSS